MTIAASVATTTFEDVVWSKQEGSLSFTANGISFQAEGRPSENWSWEKILAFKRGSSSAMKYKVKIVQVIGEKPVVLTLPDGPATERFCNAFDNYYALYAPKRLPSSLDPDNSETEFTDGSDFIERNIADETNSENGSALDNKRRQSVGQSLTEGTSISTKNTSQVKYPLDPLERSHTTGTDATSLATRTTMRSSHLYESERKAGVPAKAIYVDNGARDSNEVTESYRDEPDTELAHLHAANRSAEKPQEKKKSLTTFLWRTLSGCLMCLIIILLISILGVGIGNLKKDESTTVVVDEGARSTTFAPISPGNNAGEEVEYGNCPYEITDLDERADHFMSTGCFGDASSVETHRVFCSSPDLQAMECSVRCFTRLFGVTDGLCKCFSQVPSERLGISSCDIIVAERKQQGNTRGRRLQSNTTTPVEQAQPMELYVSLQTNEECRSEITKAVRDFFVQEDNAPFGFDIVENTFRDSPFQLFNDECGTNIYEIYTDVSDNQMSTSTSIQNIEEFSDSRREEAALAIGASVSAGYNGGFVSAAVSVSASSDKEQTNLFESSGAAEVNSKVFISTAVKRVAQIEIPDFEKRESIVTFSATFARRLKDFIQGGYQQEAAFDILNEYGQFVVTRGIFGGYMERRMTISGSTFESFESEEATLSECFQAEVTGDVSSFGASVSASASAATCDEEETQKMKSARDQFASETSEQGVYGGLSKCEAGSDGSLSCSFTVEPQTSRLLITKDKYPANDEGIRLLPLAAFLDPAKVSPLEVKRWHIAEDEFATAKEMMEEHTLAYFELTKTALELCNCTGSGIPFLVENPLSEVGGKSCDCFYQSTIAPTSSPTASPTLDPALCEGTGSRNSNMINDEDTPTDVGAKMGDDFCLNSWFGLACGGNGSWDKFKTIQGTEGQWFTGKVTDASTCTGKLEHLLRLRLPAEVDYSLFVWKGSPTGDPDYQVLAENVSGYDAEKVTTIGFATESDGSRKSDLKVAVHDGGGEDGFRYYVKLEHAGGGSCQPWTLEFFNHQC